MIKCKILIHTNKRWRFCGKKAINAKKCRKNLGRFAEFPYCKEHINFSKKDQRKYE